MRTGVALAFSWLTVLPVRGPEVVDRRAARGAIAATPIVGIVLGALVAIVVWLAWRAGAPAPLAGLIGVAAHALATRGMHVDGLSDTADGLGCYGDPERARTVLRSGSAGPFGVATLVVCLGAQAMAMGELAERGALVAVVVAGLVSRTAVVLACRGSVPPDGSDGFGALVAGTQGRVTVALWSVAALVAATAAIPDRWWQGVVVAAALIAGTALFVRHCVRRFGGLVGDVLGATIELTVTVFLVACLVAG